jgi:toxin ParE1/3/4
MSSYTLAEEADQDFEAIFEYGLDTFGKKAAMDHQNNLIRHFEDLAKFPLHYQAVDHIRKDYRRSVCGVHTIFYRIDDDHITIIRILGRQDPFRALN